MATYLHYYSRTPAPALTRSFLACKLLSILDKTESVALSCHQRRDSEDFFQQEVTEMRICFKLGGKVHCFDIPILEVPIVIKPHPPENYERLFGDATIIATVQSLAQKIGDKGVRDAVEGGVKTAVQAMKKRADYAESISLEG
jgi:hypothetical protein